MFTLAIIIVTYNCSSLLRDCLASIARYTMPADCQLIIVDNASEDFELVYSITSEYSNATVIRNSRNWGFGIANNIGMAHSSSDCFLLLNPDTIVGSNAIGELMERGTQARGSTSIGAYGVRLRDARGDPAHSFGEFPSVAKALLEKIAILAAPLRRPSQQKRQVGAIPGGDSGDSAVRDVDYVTGACMLIPKSVLIEVGGFDEAFFMYCEEAELEWRMRKSGYRRVLLPIFGIAHLEGKTFKATSTRKTMQEAGIIRFLSKRASRGWFLAFALTFVLLSCMESLLRFALGRWTAAESISYLRDILAELPIGGKKNGSRC